jgi:hypothetical protein
MFELKKNGKVFTSKFVGPRAAVSQSLGNTALDLVLTARYMALCHRGNAWFGEWRELITQAFVRFPAVIS